MLKENSFVAGLQSPIGKSWKFKQEEANLSLVLCLWLLLSFFVYFFSFIIISHNIVVSGVVVYIKIKIFNNILSKNQFYIIIFFLIVKELRINAKKYTKYFNNP